MMLIPIILIGAVIFLYYNKGQTTSVNITGARDNSLEILNERFARGEIDENEYNHKKNILLNHKSL